MARRLQSKGEGFGACATAPLTLQKLPLDSSGDPHVTGASCLWGILFMEDPTCLPASTTGFLLPQGGQERRKSGQKVHRTQSAQVGVCPLLKRALCLHLRYLPSNIGSIEDPAERTVLLALIIPCGVHGDLWHLMLECVHQVPWSQTPEEQYNAPLYTSFIIPTLSPFPPVITTHPFLRPWRCLCSPKNLLGATLAYTCLLHYALHRFSWFQPF